MFRLRLFRLFQQSLLLPPLQAAAPQAPQLRAPREAPKAASNRKAGRALAAPLAHTCWLSNSQCTGHKRIYAFAIQFLLRHPLRRHCG